MYVSSGMKYMTRATTNLRGIVRGKTIDLDHEAGFPDGQVVSVSLHPALPAGEGLRRSYGAWSEDAAELDAFVEQLRLGRKRTRADLES
jgi:hypothetical protein